MNNQPYNDDDCKYNEEYEEPLFSKLSVITFSIIFLIFGISSSVIFNFINNKIIKVVYIYEYNERLMSLLTFKIALFMATIFIIALIVYRLYHYSYESLSSYLGFNKPNWGFLLLWTAILIGLHSLSWADGTNKAHLEISENIFNYGIWITLLSTVIIAPVCEEIICRGFLWRATLDAFQSEKMAFMVSSTVFALAHYRFALPAIIFYFISSWLFLRARTTGGTLAFAIFLHFLHNFALVLETLVMMSN